MKPVGEGERLANAIICKLKEGVATRNEVEHEIEGLGARVDDLQSRYDLLRAKVRSLAELEEQLP